MRLSDLHENLSNIKKDLFDILQPKDRIIMSPKEIGNFKPPTSLGQFTKPSGCLWYAFGSEWLRFTEMAGWTQDYNHLYELKITNESKILKINTSEDVQKFGQQYGITPEEINLIDKYNRKITPELYEQLKARRKPTDRNSYGDKINTMQFICWDLVRPHWSGIEIPNYWDVKDIETWNGNWDASSGCIWSSDVIKEIVKII